MRSRTPTSRFAILILLAELDYVYRTIELRKGKCRSNGRW